ncbi:hypothetical protein ACFL12_01670 [Pseudomonadota bacterium]
MNMQRKTITPASLNAILDYLTAELDEASTEQEFDEILKLAKVLLLKAPTQNAVTGLDNVRADLDPTAMNQAQNVQYDRRTGQDRRQGKAKQATSQTLQIEVPTTLSGAFADLSNRMRTLQDQDPDSFANAANALNWLANGELCTN